MMSWGGQIREWLGRGTKEFPCVAGKDSCLCFKIFIIYMQIGTA